MCTSWPALLRPGVACALWLDWSRLLLAMEYCLCTCSFLSLESLYSVFGSSNPWPFYTTEMVYLSTRLLLPLYVCVLYLMVISRLGSCWDGGQKGSGIITDNSPDLLPRCTLLNKVTWYCNEVQESHVYHMHPESITDFGTGCEGFIWRYIHTNSTVPNNGVCVLWKCLFWIQSCWKLD